MASEKTTEDLDDFIGKGSLLDDNGLAYFWSKVKSYITNKDIKAGIPVGSSTVWYGKEVDIPLDWMREDGRQLKVADYPQLFARIGYTYGGSGDNFNLPDSRGRDVIHYDGTTEFSALGYKGGAKTHYHWQNTVYGTIGSLTYVGITNQLRYRGLSVTMGYGATVDTKGSVWTGGTQYGTEDGSSLGPYITAFRIMKVKEDAYTEDLRNLDSEIVKVQSKLQLLEAGLVAKGKTFKAYKDAQQAVTEANKEFSIVFQKGVGDTDYFSLNNSKIYIDSPHITSVIVTAQLQCNRGGKTYLYIYKNGKNEFSTNKGEDHAPSFNVTLTVKQGDYIELKSYWDGTGMIQLADTWTFLQVTSI